MSHERTRSYQRYNRTIGYLIMRSFRNILLGIDLNHFSQEFVKFAAGIARTHNAKLVAIYTYKPFTPLLNISISKSDQKKSEKEFKRQLVALCEANIPKSVNWEAVVIEGKPVYQTLIKAAKELKSDLIVVKEHDRHQRDEIFLGSNTEKIVRYAPCSVFVYRKR